jgi:saccharopine dehydrogenase-like NADP-dependent oxidoreductase
MTASPPFPIVIVGSTGAFGSKIAELLVRVADIRLVLAGRTRAALETQAEALARAGGRSPEVAVLDATRITAQELMERGVRLVINASGPYQRESYGLARAAIAAGSHYIDLADAREFVCGFDALDEDARKSRVLAVSGASSVPGLSSAVVERYRSDFRKLDTLDIAISPGNSFDPGVATVASVLCGVGQPLKMLCDGRWETVHGWQGLRRQDFGRAGKRWVGHVDVPDLALFPRHGADLETVRFQAGLEVALFHLGLWSASWLVRAGLLRSLEPLAANLLAVKRRLSWLGSDRGGMVVTMCGAGHDGKQKALTWRLVAQQGHGPYVPALASVALARRLAAGIETQRGAKACFGVVSLEDILAEASGLDISCATHEEALPP